MPQQQNQQPQTAANSVGALDISSSPALIPSPPIPAARPGRSDVLIPFTNFFEGWNSRLDPVKAPGFGIMSNVVVTDRGGVSPRPGTELFGASNSSGTPVTSLHTMHKRDGTQIMMRASGTILEYYNPLSASWATLKVGFTSGQVFGFADHNVNTQLTDYVYFCNAVEPYQRWTGAYDKTTGSVLAAAVTIPITSTLQDEVYFSGTATSVTTTTITMPASTWAADIWNGFYVRITNGAASGQISAISATTSTQITFTAIGTLAGTPTFEIRRLKFASATPTIVYNAAGATVAVTGITTDAALTVASAPALSSGDPLAEVPQELMSNSCPRGNILRVLFSAMYVAGVKKSPCTVYRSKIGDASDFRYSATRVAGEGDVVDFPEDGGAISDLDIFEDRMAVFKKSSIHNMTYSQDGNDLVNKAPMVQSPLIGTNGRVFRMGDDIVFVSPTGEITTMSRVSFRDTRPLRTNIAWPIKGGIQNFDWSTARGRTFKNYSLIAGKETEDSTTNDKVLVFDNNLQRWIGDWDLPASAFTVYYDELYMASSASVEVYKMFTDTTSQVKGATVAGYDTAISTNWVNKTSDGLSNQSFDLIAITGYVSLGTPITFELFYDFENEATFTWTFDPSDETIAQYNILGDDEEAVLGAEPLGTTPLGVEIGEVEGLHGERRFLVYYAMPFRDHVWSKLGWSSSGTNKYYEITDVSANFTESTAQASQSRVRSIEGTS